MEEIALPGSTLSARTIKQRVQEAVGLFSEALPDDIFAEIQRLRETLPPGRKICAVNLFALTGTCAHFVLTNSACVHVRMAILRLLETTDVFLDLLRHENGLASRALARLLRMQSPCLPPAAAEEGTPNPNPSQTSLQLRRRPLPASVKFSLEEFRTSIDPVHGVYHILKEMPEPEEKIPSMQPTQRRPHRLGLRRRASSLQEDANVVLPPSLTQRHDPYSMIEEGSSSLPPRYGGRYPIHS